MSNVPGPDGRDSDGQGSAPQSPGPQSPIGQDPDGQSPAGHGTGGYDTASQLPPPPAPGLPRYGENDPRYAPQPGSGYGGVPGYPGVAYAQPPTQTIPGHTLGIVAFIVSFFMSWLGLILGIVAMVQSRHAGHKNGFALAAVIIGSVFTVLGIIGGIILAVVIGSAAAAAQQCAADPSQIVHIWGIAIDCSSLVSGVS